MTIRKFVVFSLVFHFVLFSGLYIIPEPKVEKAREFITKLVSPEELNKPEIRVSPPPKIAPPSVLPPKGPPRRRRVPPVEKAMPTRPALPRRPDFFEKPIVPGEGKESGEPLPEGLKPKAIDKTGNGKASEGVKKHTDRQAKPGLSERDELFDRNIIEETARNDTGNGSGSRRGKKEDALTFDTEDYRYAGYMSNLRQKIESIWVYPPEAAAKGIYGDLKIRFTIKKDGRLGAVELVRTSGHKMLDDAAMKALRDGEPYWPIPDSWGRDAYTITGHFIYLYGGYYLR